MKFLEIITGGCLINVAKIICIYEVVDGVSSFPIRSDDEQYPETGLYLALKVGLECQTLPLVMLSRIKSIAGIVLNECESRHYLEALNSIHEQYFLFTLIIAELKWRMQHRGVCIDTWNVVMTCILKHSVKISADSDDDEADRESSEKGCLA